MKELKFSEPTGPMFHYDPPNEESLGDEPLIGIKMFYNFFFSHKTQAFSFFVADPLDDYYVEIRPYSEIPGGGEGSFAKVDIPKGTVFSIFSGYVYKAEHSNKLREKEQIMRDQGILSEDPRMLAVWMYRYTVSSEYHELS